METIRSDLRDAMRARDKVRLRSLRAIIAAVQEAEVAGSEAETLNDAGVMKVIKAQVKRRLEASEAFEAGDRPESAAAEREEIVVLECYLPVGLSDHELEGLVNSVMGSNGFTSKDQMGAAMKAVNGAVQGRADGRKVAKLVKARLS